MGKASAETVIAASPSEVFAYVDDYQNTPKYMHGLKSWEPAGEQTHGVGAVFIGKMDAVKTWESTLEITQRDEDEAIAWIPTKGFKQGGAWQFAPEGDGTRVTLTVDYEFPGGLAGKAVAKAAEPVVKQNVQKSVEKLKQLMEQGG